MTRIGWAALLALWLVAPARGQEPARDLERTVSGTLQIQQQTQQRQDDWAAERNELQTRYHAAKANVSYLTARREVEARKAEALDASVREMERNLAEAMRLEAGVQDTMLAVLGRLETAVARDLPFLQEERGARLASVRDEIARPEVTPAEKLRRLLEALQVEAGYGGTLEITQEQIELDGEPTFVDLLRIGRLSLFWRTGDGKRVGEYDRGEGRWVELPGRHRRAIGEAMAMASRMRPIEIIGLPIGRIAP